ncbi:MAG: hypothetical protein Q8936_23615 [Bacillota bacterium]|nr:hypothetical protein [Bacillota bacterium]
MTNEWDYIYVGGNFAICTDYNEIGCLTDGVLEIEGDFSQWGNAYSFAASGNNKVVLDGYDNQLVSMNSSNSSFAILDCIESSGIIFETPISIKNNLYGMDNILGDKTLTLLNSNITLIDNTELGINLKLVNSNLNLNGYELKIDGYLDQIGGNINQTDGVLNISGKYTLDGKNMFPEEVIRNFVLGMFASLVNNELENLNIIQTALNTFFGGDYAAYQYRILEDYKNGGLEALESKVTLKDPYYAGKVVTDAVLFTGGLIALGDCINLFIEGCSGVAASGVLEIFSGGTLTPAVAVTATGSAVAVVAGLVGAAEFGNIAYNAAKNGVNDASNLIKAIEGAGTEGAGKAEAAIAGISDAEAIAEGITDVTEAEAIATGRPSWRQSEVDIFENTYTEAKGYTDQAVFVKDSNGIVKEGTYGQPGSIRIDIYKADHIVEVKNYNVTTSTGRSNLVQNIRKQYWQRKDFFPNTKQTYVLDIGGQNVTDEVLLDLQNSIYNETETAIEIVIKQ